MTRLLTDEEIGKALGISWEYLEDRSRIDSTTIVKAQDTKTLKAAGEWVLEDIYPCHLRVWADTTDKELKYKDSQLSFFLRGLADKVDQLKQGKIPEEG